MNEPGVIGIVFDADRQQVLLVKRRDVPIWVLPGGGIDPGEEPAAAAVREIREESGLIVEVVRQIGQYTGTGRLSAETFVFECRVTGGTASPSDETSDVRFFAIDCWPKPVFEIHRNWLDDALSDEPTLIRKPIQGLSWSAIARMLLLHPVLCARYLLSRIAAKQHGGQNRS